MSLILEKENSLNNYGGSFWLVGFVKVSG